MGRVGNSVGAAADHAEAESAIKQPQNDNMDILKRAASVTASDSTNLRQVNLSCAW